MNVFLSRKRQPFGKVDFANATLQAILICSDKHTIMIDEAIKNNSKANAHYGTKKALYVHYVNDEGMLEKVESYK